ncbi:MAG TPA: glutamate--cysteine ligase [Marmoricola sp.]|nr:glutamate--cysteine ligase [Marmoricola sp.]
MRTVGIEEELLLVDARTGEPRALASQVLRVAEARGEVTDDLERGSIVHELQEEQLETYTPPESDLDCLGQDLRMWRAAAIADAAEVGATVIASGTSPLPATPRLVRTPRYERMADRFGLTTSEQLTGGCHVHVSVDSLEEGVGVLDRIRLWLSVLLALSANSPYWNGRDTGYDSYRSQAQARWPTTGPTEVYGSVAAYRQHIDHLLGSGVPLDEGMLYTEARLSRHYPTVEVRIADVCLEVDDAVLLAALARGLVETAAREHAAGETPAPVSVSILRLATWQAGKAGVRGDLLDPSTARPVPARTRLEALVAHIADALRDAGDLALVEQGIERVLVHGTGAGRQRAVLGSSGSLTEVVRDLARRTAGEC